MDDGISSFLQKKKQSNSNLCNYGKNGIISSARVDSVVNIWKIVVSLF